MPNPCAICGEDDPRVLKEYHHIFGRANISETILLCHNCHDKITKTQNEFPPFARKKNAPEVPKIAFIIRSIGTLLKLIGEQLIKFSDNLLEEWKKCQK
jgi:hypothetical protein